MKFNSLQFGKAISAALFVLLLVVVGMKNALAQTQVATLQHGEDISVFYGNNAFVEAHTAAVDGDIVTLSSGTFTTTAITKAITLRGTGAVVNTETGTYPTVFANSISFNVQNDSVPLKVEGVSFLNGAGFGILYNPKFMKCNFNGTIGSSNTTNAQFINCIIRKVDFEKMYNTTFINSVVWEATHITDTYSVLLYNSILGSGGSNFNGLTAYNSIFIRKYNYNNVPYYNCTFINCIGIRLENQSPFGYGYASGCIIRSSYDAVFESFTGNFSVEEQFILKDNIATGFLGTDGTQVGIHGGLVPYSPRPSYMKIEHCNVANRSTIDGKLSVDIEVVNEGE